MFVFSWGDAWFMGDKTQANKQLLGVFLVACVLGDKTHGLFMNERETRVGFVSIHRDMPMDPNGIVRFGKSSGRKELVIIEEKVPVYHRGLHKIFMTNN